MLYPHCPYERNAMDDERHRDADNYETICRTVNGLDGKSMIHEHDGQKVPPTKVYVDRKPRSGDVMGAYNPRQRVPTHWTERT